MQKKINEQTPLATYLSEIPEFRRQNKNFVQPLLEILLLSISAVFCGAEYFEEITLFGKEKESFLKKLLPFANGIPSHDTLRRVFMLLDSAIFNEKFMSWVSEVSGFMFFRLRECEIAK